MLGKRLGSSILLLLGVLVLLPSCQSKRNSETAGASKVEPKTASPGAAKSEARKEVDGYQRMKECAEQADKVVKRRGWVEGQRTGDISIIDWQNHYSPKYGRCFIQANYKNHLTQKDRDMH